VVRPSCCTAVDGVVDLFRQADGGGVGNLQNLAVMPGSWATILAMPWMDESGDSISRMISG
jgi:hypothetical protein